ncbi:MAG: cupin domain-containing protein [bacterium]|nr:cupin domain-containing protein [bacterium]
MKRPFKKSLNQIPQEEAHGGTGSRQLLLSKSDPISIFMEAMTKGYLKAGAKFDWHFHDKIDEFFLVIKGVGIIEFKDDKPMKYQEGDLIYIPSNIEHRIIASERDDNEFYFIRLQSE